MLVRKTVTYNPPKKDNKKSASGEARVGDDGWIERTFTTLSIPLPASSRMFFTPSQHAFVLSAMLPETSSPEAVAGIWPET